MHMQRAFYMCKVGYLKVMEFPYFIMEKSWNLKIQEQDPDIFVKHT